MSRSYLKYRTCTDHVVKRRFNKKLGGVFSIITASQQAAAPLRPRHVLSRRHIRGLLAVRSSARSAASGTFSGWGSRPDRAGCGVPWVSSTGTHGFFKKWSSPVLLRYTVL
ncbi:hypothetical protein MHYP_G00320160 [Metynnis hypsauchen]